MAVDITQIGNPAKVSFDLYNKDNTNPAQYLDWGWPILNKAIIGLDKGVFLVASPPNQGKSQLLKCCAQQLIDKNDDVFVVDFTLDDDREERIRGYVAAIAKLPINWIKYPNASGMTDSLRQLRMDSYKDWSRRTDRKLRIVDTTDFDESASQFSSIKDSVKQFRDLHSDKKLVVVIDSFHDIVVDNFRGDDMERQRYLSEEIKNLATTESAIILASTHTPKGSLKRGLDQDAVLGTGRTSFDARVIGTIFSDLSVNRSAAQIYHHAVLPHTGSQHAVPQPVIELDLTKNKAGSFRNVIFYRHYPEYGYVEEAEKQWQTTWHKTISGQP